MRRAFASIALLALVFFPAVTPARGDERDALAGRYAFNWLSDPGRQKCAPVDQKLLQRFKSKAYRCDLKGRRNPAGATIVSCKGQSKEYLIFKTQKACENERETQAVAE